MVQDMINDLIEQFRVELRVERDIELSEAAEAVLRERLKEHEDCVEGGWVEIALYGCGEDVSMECTKCNEVILDSDLIEAMDEED